MLSHGVVRQWRDDEGFGVIDSPDTPGGCWVSFSSIIMDGYRSLTAGEQVTFSHESAQQDGFAFRAVLVWPPGVEPGPAPPREDGEPSAAYRSALTIRWSDGTMTTRADDDGLPIRPAGQGGS